MYTNLSRANGRYQKHKHAHEHLQNNRHGYVVHVELAFTLDSQIEYHVRECIRAAIVLFVVGSDLFEKGKGRIQQNGRFDLKKKWS